MPCNRDFEKYPVWNKGKTGVYSDETLKKMGQKNIGNTYRLGKKGKAAWNKGLTKETNLSVQKISEKMKQNVWSKGLQGDEYWAHFKKKVDYTASIKSHQTDEYRKKASENRRKTIAEGRGVLVPTEQQRKASSIRLREQRQDIEFNRRMFASFRYAVTKPHKKVQRWIQEHTTIQTTPNYPFWVGTRVAEIDEADPQRKIAIFIDGDYWHNLPNRQQWDKCCTTCLQNQGWKVLRIWESDINNNPQKVIDTLVGGIQ